MLWGGLLQRWYQNIKRLTLTNRTQTSVGSSVYRLNATLYDSYKITANKRNDGRTKHCL
jgi:hypothetical protein